MMQEVSVFQVSILHLFLEGGMSGDQHAMIILQQLKRQWEDEQGLTAESLSKSCVL
jgi:hypothetical protein